MTRRIAILFACFALAGCFDLDQKMTLGRDGSGSYEVTLTADGMVGEALKNEVLITESKGAVQRETEIVNGHAVHREHIAFASIADLGLADEDVSLTVHGDNFFGLAPKSATFRRVVRSADVRSEKSPEDKDDSAALAAVFGNHTYSFSLSLPGSIDSIAPVKLGGVTIKPEITGDYFRHTITWRMPLYMMFAEDKVVFTVDFSAYGTFSDAQSQPKRSTPKRASEIPG
jgi:hypothetical protein